MGRCALGRCRYGTQIPALTSGTESAVTAASSGEGGMGSHLMRRPPKFVQGFIDRHGKARFYTRRKGFPKTPLPGVPWSPEFTAAYTDALAVKPVIQIRAGVDKVVR